MRKKPGTEKEAFDLLLWCVIIILFIVGYITGG